MFLSTLPITLVHYEKNMEAFMHYLPFVVFEMVRNQNCSQRGMYLTNSNITTMPRSKQHAANRNTAQRSWWIIITHMNTNKTPRIFSSFFLLTHNFRSIERGNQLSYFSHQQFSFNKKINTTSFWQKYEVNMKHCINSVTKNETFQSC